MHLDGEIQSRLKKKKKKKKKTNNDKTNFSN